MKNTFRKPLLTIFAMAFMTLLPSLTLLAEETDKVFFDRAGRLIVKGKPEFPLGIYVAISPSSFNSDPKNILAALDDLQNSPFDILINYAGPGGSPEERLKYLDELHKRGLREMFSLKDYYQKPGGKPNPHFKGQSEKEAIRRDVRFLKHHPAILGWYICDERYDESTVYRHNRWVKAEDPLHPTLAVYEWGKLRHADKKLVFTADILATDPYPIAIDPIKIVAQHTDKLLEITGDKLPAWLVIQAFGRYVYKKDFRDVPGPVQLSSNVVRGKERAPTPREMRCMTYLALTHGATGIIYYYYKDIMISYDAKARWEAVKTIGQEVRNLSPILLSPDYTQGKIVGDNPLIHWKAKAMDNKIFLMAVNSSTSTQSIVLKLPGAVGNASLHTGQGTSYLHHNELLLVLDGYEAVVVELDGQLTN